MIKRNMVVILSVISSILYWFIESFIHFYLLNESEFELLPHDLNELLMRTTVMVLIIVIGIIYQRYMHFQMRLQQERLRVMKATMVTVQDIVGNALNNLYIIRMEAEAPGSLQPETLERLDSLISHTSERLRTLANMDVTPVREVASGVYGIEIEGKETNER